MNVVVVCNKTLKKTMNKFLPSKEKNIRLIATMTVIPNVPEFIQSITETYVPHCVFWEHGVKCVQSDEKNVIIRLKETQPNLKIIFHVMNKTDISDYENFMRDLIDHGIYDIILGARPASFFQKAILNGKTKDEAYIAADIESPSAERILNQNNNENYVELEKLFESGDFIEMNLQNNENGKTSADEEEIDLEMLEKARSFAESYNPDEYMPSDEAEEAESGAEEMPEESVEEETEPLESVSVAVTNEEVRSVDEEIFTDDDEEEIDLEMLEKARSFAESYNPDEYMPSDEAEEAESGAEEMPEESVEEETEPLESVSVAVTNEEVRSVDEEIFTDDDEEEIDLEMLEKARSFAESYNPDEYMPSDEAEEAESGAEETPEESVEEETEPLESVSGAVTNEEVQSIDEEIFTNEQSETANRGDSVSFIGNVSVGVAQLISRTGATYTTVEIANWLANCSCSVGVVFNSNEDYEEFGKYFLCDISKDSYRYKKVNYYPPQKLALAQGSNNFTIVDFGDDWDNDNFDRCMLKIMLCDFAPWNAKTIENHIGRSKKSYLKQVHYLFHVGQKRFAEKIAPLKKRGFSVYCMNYSDSCLDTANEKIYQTIFAGYVFSSKSKFKRLKRKW